MVLAVLLGATGVAIDLAFQEYSLGLVETRLKAQALMLISAAEYEAGSLEVRYVPELGFTEQDSGLYAEILDGKGKSVWRSPSLQQSPSLHEGERWFLEPPEHGGSPPHTFKITQAPDGKPVLAISVPWDLTDEDLTDEDLTDEDLTDEDLTDEDLTDEDLTDEDLTEADASRVVFLVTEQRDNFDALIGDVRTNFWSALAAVAVVLVAVLALVLVVPLTPIGRISRELREMENGGRDELSDNYPRELLALTMNLNAMIKRGNDKLKKIRTQLQDLDHELRTPLTSLIYVATENDRPSPMLEQSVRKLVKHMELSIRYHLDRADGSGRMTIPAIVDATEGAREVRNMLAKVHAHRDLKVVITPDDAVCVRADKMDLMQVLENLMDNACKWAEGQVRVSLSTSGNMLVIAVEDDGPGIEPENICLALSRGGRLDTSQSGDGLGLAIIHDLVADSGGNIEITASQLGGTCVRACLDCGLA